jgi:hypothetical protein
VALLLWLLLLLPHIDGFCLRAAATRGQCESAAESRWTETAELPLQVLLAALLWLATVGSSTSQQPFKLPLPDGPA